MVATSLVAGGNGETTLYPLQNLLDTVPLTAADWLVVLGLAVPILLITETVKIIAWRRSGADGVA